MVLSPLVRDLEKIYTQLSTVNTMPTRRNAKPKRERYRGFDLLRDRHRRRVFWFAVRNDYALNTDGTIGGLGKEMLIARTAAGMRALIDGMFPQ